MQLDTAISLSLESRYRLGCGLSVCISLLLCFASLSSSQGLLKSLAPSEGASAAAELRDLLHAGFPFAHRRLRGLAYRCLRYELEDIREGRIPLDKSARLTMIPDPFNVLGPNEVYVHSSVETYALDGGILEGDLVGLRSPSHLPSDVVKMKAVSPRKLARCFENVAIFNVRDAVSLAERMSGGDFDGDEVRSRA